MSLIHEALKKAEQQRRLGEPPTLGTPFAREQRRRPLLPFLVLAIAGALGAGWWLTRDAAPDAAQSAGSDAAAAAATAAAAQAARAPDGPAAAGAPTAGADTAPASTAAGRRPTMGANAVANTHVVDTLAPPPQVLNQAPPASGNPPTIKETAERESEPHPPGANPLAPGEAAPLTLGAAPPETPVNDAAGLASKMAVKEKEMASGASAPAPSGAASGSPFIKERPVRPPPVATAPKAPAPVAGATATATTAAVTPPPAAPPSPPPTMPAGAGPAAIGATAPAAESLPAYWQLPYNLRKELPELKLSMHVYSATPAQRFIVLNGNRQVEGDELGGEVRVSEIRSDGVVLTFQGQRFLVPRGGS